MGSRSSLPANGSRERAPDDRLREASISPRKSRVREEWIASSLTLLARNWGSERRPPQSKLSSPGLTGRSSTPRPLDLSQTPLEYWVPRSSRAMTAVFVSFIRVGPKAGTQLAMTTRNKNGRDCSRPFHFVNASPQRGGATPGGGGGNDAVPPLSSGVMRRTVTRRLIRLGPLVCSFGYCEP